MEMESQIISSLKVALLAGSVLGICWFASHLFGSNSKMQLAAARIHYHLVERCRLLLLLSASSLWNWVQVQSLADGMLLLLTRRSPLLFSLLFQFIRVLSHY